MAVTKKKVAGKDKSTPKTSKLKPTAASKSKSNPISVAGRAKIAAAQKKRWAAYRKAKKASAKAAA